MVGYEITEISVHYYNGSTDTDSTPALVFLGPCYVADAMTDKLGAKLGENPNLPEKRAWTRYNPDPKVPVVFRGMRSPQLSAGDIVDISAGGLRLEAPCASGSPMLWGDKFVMTVAYSESNRKAGIEGLVLEAVAVEVISNAKTFVIRGRFINPGDHTQIATYIRTLEIGKSEIPQPTVDFSPEREKSG